MYPCLEPILDIKMQGENIVFVTFIYDKRMLWNVEIWAENGKT